MGGCRGSSAPFAAEVSLGPSPRLPSELQAGAARATAMSETVMHRVAVRNRRPANDSRRRRLPKGRGCSTVAPLTESHDMSARSLLAARADCRTRASWIGQGGTVTETASCGTNVGGRYHPKPCGRPATHVVDGHLPMCEAHAILCSDATGADVRVIDLGPRLVLICGLPASGKSTLARQLAPKIRAIRLDKDRWTTRLGLDVWDDELRVRVEGQLWELAQELLANGQSVILEWGHWARAERDEKRLGARALGVAVELRYLDASLEELIERAERRSASGEWTASPMTRAHFERWAQVFEPPDEEEMRLFDPPVAEVPSAP